MIESNEHGACRRSRRVPALPNTRQGSKLGRQLGLAAGTVAGLRHDPKPLQRHGRFNHTLHEYEPSLGCPDSLATPGHLMERILFDYRLLSCCTRS